MTETQQAQPVVGQPPTAPAPSAPPPDPDSNPGMANPAALQGQDDFAGFDNYWGTDETEKVMLPDGVQYFIIKKLDEGEKSQFQKLTSRDVILQQRTGDARMNVDPSQERHELIRVSVTDWYLLQLAPKADPKVRDNWTEAPFSKRNLDQWLNKANPAAVEKLETAIRVFNPWLQGEMTVSDIDEEIDRLVALKKATQERESGEAASANK